MTVNAHILEKVQIVEGFPIVDLKTGANSGDYVSLKGYKRCAIVFFSSAGAAGEPPTVTLQQAQDVSGTAVKNLTTVTTFYVKQATTDLTGTGQWTKVTQAAANTFTRTAGNQDKLWVYEVREDQLDSNNGFDCLRATIASVGSTIQLGGLLYILHDPRYPDAPENQLSAIVD
jgi:hypothetical protein